jgi:hypothetical protein
MNINSLKERKFLTKEDCGKGILVTVNSIAKENVAMEGAPEELKHCVHFKEDVKPMVLYMTNARLIAGIVGSEDTDNWTGHRIVLYCDPTISFSGKIIGGIRVRAPRNQPAAQQIKPKVEEPQSTPKAEEQPTPEPEDEPAF